MRNAICLGRVRVFNHILTKNCSATQQRLLIQGLCAAFMVTVNLWPLELALFGSPLWLLLLLLLLWLPP